MISAVGHKATSQTYVIERCWAPRWGNLPVIWREHQATWSTWQHGFAFTFPLASYPVFNVPLVSILKPGRETMTSSRIGRFASGMAERGRRPCW